MHVHDIGQVACMCGGLFIDRWAREQDVKLARQIGSVLQSMLLTFSDSARRMYDVFMIYI